MPHWHLSSLRGRTYLFCYNGALAPRMWLTNITCLINTCLEMNESKGSNRVLNRNTNNWTQPRPNEWGTPRIWFRSQVDLRQCLALPINWVDNALLYQLIVTLSKTPHLSESDSLSKWFRMLTLFLLCATAEDIMMSKMIQPLPSWDSWVLLFKMGIKRTKMAA